MPSCQVNIFGTKFACPQGLRKSPGTHWFHQCIKASLSGSRPGTKQGAQDQLASAARSCQGSRR